MSNQATSRRRFRFSLRTLLLMKSAAILVTFPVIAFGCQTGETGGQVGNAGAAEIKQGQNLDEVIKKMKSMGLMPSEENAAVAFESTHRHKIVMVGNWGDALFVVATAKDARSPFVVTRLYWYKQWEQDSQLPKSQRRRETEFISQVDLKALIRERGRPRPVPGKEKATTDPFSKAEKSQVNP